MKENEVSHPLGKVMVVDDEPTLVSVVSEMSTNLGYETTGFGSAKKALSALLEENFDILLTDVVMPEMDGIELLHAAFRLDRYLIGVLMTGYQDIQSAVGAIQVGAFDYIEKPFNQVTLSSVLSRAMNMHRLKSDNIQLREAVSIHELAKTVASSFNVDVILDELADAAQGLVEADEVSIMVPEENGEEGLRIAAARGEHLQPFVGAHVSAEEGVVAWVVNNKETLTLNGALASDRFPSSYSRDDIFSAISMPILSGGKLLGVLNVKTTHSQRLFRPGQVKGLSVLVGLVAPILENSRLYEKVHLAEKKYRSIFDNATEGIYQATEDKTYIAANKALAYMYGFASPEELITGIHDIEKEQFVEPSFYRDFIAALLSKGSVENYEVQQYCKDRSIIWVALSGRTVYDKEGKLLYFEGSCQDITVRKSAEEAVKRERNTLMQFIDNLPLLAYGVSREGKIINCNNMAVNILGYRGKNELIGKSATVLYAPECRDDVLDIIGRWEKKQKIKNEENKIITKQGNILDVILNVHMVSDKENHPLYFIATQLDITQRKIMEEELKETVTKLKKATGAIIDTLVIAVEARDPYTAGHQKRVSDLAAAIAEKMGLDSDRVYGIKVTGMIHDLGKISIPAEILSLPRKLTDLERSLVRTHSTVGYDILKDVEFSWPVAQIVLQHHEHFDGSGYPHGIRGDQILLEARIMAVADVVEAMASHRPYRPALGIDAAMEEIEKRKGTYYDPEVVNACADLIRQDKFRFE